MLSHVLCIPLDGTAVEPVDAEAKDLAAKQLAKLSARNGPKQTAPAKAKPKPASSTDRVRAKPARSADLCRQHHASEDDDEGPQL